MKTYTLFGFAFTAILLMVAGVSQAQLSGNYTIGGGSPDFASISDAVNELQTNGVSGPVTFNLRSGTYEENNGTERVLYIEQQISGASDTNTVTFQPDAATSATVDDVILKRIVGSYDEKGWIAEIRSDGITLKELTIEYADTSTAAYGPNTSFAFVYLQWASGSSGISDITITGCKMLGTSTVQRSPQGILLINEASNITITDNLIDGSKDGIIMAGGGSWRHNITISGNTFLRLLTNVTAVGNWQGYGVKIERGTDGIVIRNNIFDYRGGYGVDAIHINAIIGNLLIEANQILYGQNNHWGQRRFSGIHYTSSYGQATIINNMIASRTPGYPLYINASNCEIYYNTIVASLAAVSNLEDSETCFISGTGNKIYNNIFIELRSGNDVFAVLNISDTTGNSINNNCYYKAQQDDKFIKANGEFYASLSDWKNTGNDLNSIEKLPEFIHNLIDLHLGGCSVYDPELQAANPLSSFIFDLDGEERDAEFPFFGADEEDGTVPAIFTPAELTPTNDEALHFTSADLDGDGDNDFAVVNLEIGSGDVSLFWNDGNANFTGPNHISFGSIPEVIKAENIDNDNEVDLLATSDGKLLVRYGSGGGNFENEVEMPYQSDVEDFLFVDLDNDDDVDIFQTHLGTVGVQDGEVTQLINTGSRNFLYANMGSFYSGQYPSAAASGFINGDTFEDVVVVDFVNQTVSVLLNLGTGGGGIWNGFSDGVEYPIFAGSSPLHANLSVGDLDGDGDADILVGSWGGGGSDSLMILRNNGDGSFSDVEFFVVNDFRSSEVFTVFDYNDDGDLDIIVATPAHDLVYLSNEGNGNFVSFLLCHLSELGGEPLTILTKNLDSDSRPDVAVLTITDDIVVMLNLDYVVSVSEDKSNTSIPDKFSLEQNYPNPFNPSTTIRFELPVSSKVDLRVYNLLGQEVEVLINNEELSRGVHRYNFNATRLTSGVYFYRIITKDFVQTKKMVLMK
jgi:hypothetical protein